MLTCQAHSFLFLCCIRSLFRTPKNYGNGWDCVDVAAEIIKTIKKHHPEAKDAALRKKVAENLRVCFLRTKTGNKWEDGNSKGMHAKRKCHS